MAEYRILLRGVPLLSANARPNRWHKSRMVAAIREGAGWQAKHEHIPTLDRVEITGIYHPARRGRHDADNWSPTRKPAIDGLVDARVLPDDNCEHVVRTSDEIGAIDPYGPSYELVIREVEP